jgi:hypothetical protein
MIWECRGLSIKRNFEVFEPLDFLAEVTQHIPNRGEHQIRYYGFYSNKMRGQRTKRKAGEQSQEEKIVRKNAPTSFGGIIKCIFEVDPLKWQATGCCECRRRQDVGKAA